MVLRRGASLVTCAAFIAVWLLALVEPSAGQERERRQAFATRTSEPPKIDGRLDDAAWRAAKPIGEFLQVEPVEGGPPSEASEIRILYDADNLYFGMRFFDREPSRIVSTSKERDARLEVDDRVEMVIDTFHDLRNAFFFQINAAGSKGDGLITENGRNFNKPWDGIWDGIARIDELGWTAEFAIPFKTLSFREGETVWGLNLQRFIGRRNEESRWNRADQDTSLFSIADAGDLHGLAGIRQGIGLDVVPFFTTNWRKQYQGAEDSDLQGEPGVDAFYKITTDLTLSLTVNTDFAETEVDEVRFNLTRFPLFFPERRDFFLQDAGLFEFASSFESNDVIPFFSRTIGLVGGEEVPLLAGAKLTGRVGDTNVGVLDVQTDEFESLDSENLFVARVSQNVGEQSTVGGIVTHGDPTSSGDNAVFGVDANFRTSSFRGDKNLSSSAWILASDTDQVSGDELAYGASVDYPNDLWGWFANFKEIQKGFEPKLGFVPRKDIRKYSGGIEYAPRIGETVRQLEFGIDGNLITNTDDELETWDLEVQPLGIDWESGDAVRLQAEHVHDQFLSNFEISPGVIVPAGEYDYDRYSIDFESAEKRALSAIVFLSAGEFLDGDLIESSAALIWHPAPLFTGSVEYEQNDVDLPGGEFTTRLARLRTKFSFTPELSWNTFVQWDNGSDTFGINSRLRWIPTPLQEIFLVFNETLEDEGADPLFQEVAFKISYTLRF